MKLVAVELKNFRGYDQPIKIELKDLTALIGKNDVGKSTILEALDIFFNDTSAICPFEEADICCSLPKDKLRQTSITCWFDDLPNEIVIDTTRITSLKDEYLLNSDDLLEIEKRFDCHPGKKPKLTILIHALHPTNPECKDLHVKKISDLKKILDKHGIECGNKSVSSVIRKDIWNYFDGDLQLQDTEINVNKEDAKMIWDQISKELPTFSLFQSDRKNECSDGEIQDPLKHAVADVLKDEKICEHLQFVAEKVLDRLKNVADLTLEKLAELDPTIANTLIPTIPTVAELKWADVFKKVAITSEDEISIDKRGSGVKRLILLSFFRAEAERRANEQSNSCIIYGIEEPETAQHTNNQKMLIQALIQLSLNRHTQVIISTHSPKVVKSLNPDDCRIIRNDEGRLSVCEPEEGVLGYKSTNEINFIAFDETTEEYFDELYGYLAQSRIFLNRYHNKEIQSGNRRCYRRIINNNNGRREVCQERSITQIVRDQIHHPENQLNDRYSDTDLEQSIRSLRFFIRQNKSQIDSDISNIEEDDI